MGKVNIVSVSIELRIGGEALILIGEGKKYYKIQVTRSECRSPSEERLYSAQLSFLDTKGYRDGH